MPTDKTGRNLHPGQLVDIHFSGMVTGNVVRVDEPKIVVPGQPMQGTVLIQFVIGVPYSGLKCNDLYIINTPKPNNSGLVLPDGRRVASAATEQTNEPEPE